MDDKIFTKNGTDYKLRLFTTTVGLKIQRKLSMVGPEGPEAEVFFEVLSNGCYINNIAVSQKKFDDHFKGKYGELLEVFSEIIAFNFGEEDPNVGSGTED